MPHTVAALFQDEGQAFRARAQLMAVGVPHDDIVVCSTKEHDRRVKRGHADGDLADDLKHLFGLDDEDENVFSHYCQAMNDGNCLVAIDAPTEDRADQAVGGMLRLVSATDTPARRSSAPAVSGPLEVRIYARPYELRGEDKDRLVGTTESSSHTVHQACTLDAAELSLATDLAKELKR